MKPLLLVMLGGSIGSGLRYLVNVLAGRIIGLNFPWGTFAVNVIGSFAMGLLAGWFAFRYAGSHAGSLRVFLMTGVLGGFTTFSAFSLDASALWERGAPELAALYVVASVALSLGALAAGLALARSVG